MLRTIRRERIKRGHDYEPGKEMKAMREIKFRGKRGNGEWVYGSLVAIDMPNVTIWTEDHVAHLVDPKTVGQYTGLKDKNGLEIYEGDICRLGTTMYQIVWMDRYAKYGAKVIKTETVLAMGCTFPMQDYVVFSSGQCDLEIISNIYENPRLLEGTNMNIATLYEMQKELDARIIREKGLEGQDLLPNTVLALQVEIGELANEWRGFKHWSNDREPRTKVKCKKCNGRGYDYKGYVGNGWARVSSEKVECDCLDGYRNFLLEEYVDCLHFFLSIARQIGIESRFIEINQDNLDENLTKGISKLIRQVGYILEDPVIAWRCSFKLFMRIGVRLGFTWDEIATAYVAKNKVNHERQETGY